MLIMIDEQGCRVKSLRVARGPRGVTLLNTPFIVVIIPVPFGWLGTSEYCHIRRICMGLGLALVALGILIMLDRMDAGYGLKEGWPWIIVALGVGNILRNIRSLPAWITAIIGGLIVGSKYYSVAISLPEIVKTYFLPVLLIVVGLVWLWKYSKD